MTKEGAVKTKTGVAVVVGGGAHRGPNGLGAIMYILMMAVLVTRWIGVSIGSILATFAANGKIDEGKAVLASEFFRQGNHSRLTKLIARFSPLRFIGEGYIDHLSERGFLVPSGWLGLGFVRLVERFRKIVIENELVWTDNLEIVAFDLLHMEVVVIRKGDTLPNGEQVPLWIAWAASCAVPVLMQPVSVTINGVRRLLVDGGVYHPHPGKLCPEPAIVVKHFHGKILDTLFPDRTGDFSIEAGDPSIKPFARLDEPIVDRMIEFGSLRAECALADAIASGDIPTEGGHRKAA